MSNNSYPLLPDKEHPNWAAIILWGIVGVYILYGGYMDLTKAMKESKPVRQTSDEKTTTWK